MEATGSHRGIRLTRWPWRRPRRGGRSRRRPTAAATYMADLRNPLPGVDDLERQRPDECLARVRRTGGDGVLSSRAIRNVASAVARCPPGSRSRPVTPTWRQRYGPAVASTLGCGRCAVGQPHPGQDDEELVGKSRWGGLRDHGRRQHRRSLPVRQRARRGSERKRQVQERVPGMELLERRTGIPRCWARQGSSATDTSYDLTATRRQLDTTSVPSPPGQPRQLKH